MLSSFLRQATAVSDCVLCGVCAQATAEANNLAAVAAAKDLYNRKMEEVRDPVPHGHSAPYHLCHRPEERRVLDLY